MKHNVHLYYAVHVTVEGVEAETQMEAIQIADKNLDLAGLLRCGTAEDDEGGYLGALVDEVGDEDFSHTTYYVGPGARNFLEENSR